jgi:NADPH:quinone reductase-like Zn-dependent oxidoreductase
MLNRLDLRSGDKLLIAGATGGVGSFMIQLASSRGLHVIATGTQADRANLESLGAAEIVDFSEGKVTGLVKQAYPEGIEGLADLVSGPADFKTTCELVKTGGVAISSNYIADESWLAKRGLRGGNFMLNASTALVEELGAEAAAGRLKIQIQKQVPFLEALSALDASRSGKVRGKSVILLG